MLPLPSAAIAGWGGIERLHRATITRVMGRPVATSEDLSAVLAHLRERVPIGGWATVSVGFRLVGGVEIVVPDFPLTRG